MSKSLAGDSLLCCCFSNSLSLSLSFCRFQVLVRRSGADRVQGAGNVPGAGLLVQRGRLLRRVRVGTVEHAAEEGLQHAADAVGRFALALRQRYGLGRAGDTAPVQAAAGQPEPTGGGGDSGRHRWELRRRQEAFRLGLFFFSHSLSLLLSRFCLRSIRSPCTCGVVVVSP